MERSQREKLTEELTLVLLYLTSFTEKNVLMSVWPGRRMIGRH